jgi:hypothetical protein
MKRLISILTVSTCLMATTWALAGDSQSKLARVAGNRQKNAEQARVNLNVADLPSQVPTLLSEIRAEMDSTRTAEQALRAEFGPSQDPELTRRLGELKRASRMRILHIQLKYARQEGKAELVRRIQTSIEDLQRPMAPGGPRLTGRTSPTPSAKPVATPAGGSPR